ncbi:MAG: ricin-type beta-trefoil lectin domain protein [Candidatus Saccharimonadales bacterium]
MLMNLVNESRVSRRFSVGFALPTVLIASTIMMAVLLLSIQANTAVRAELMTQYYNQQARLASQSGATRAQQCISDNGSSVTWTDAKPLTPATDCSGNVVVGYPAYILTSPGVRTSFSVPAPIVSNGTQRIKVNGIVELVRSSSNVAWRTYSQALVSQEGADVSFSNVAFGYASTEGSYFATIGLSGDVNALGYNGQGQLGTGDTTSSSTPQPFSLPGGVKATQLATNYLSLGTNMFAITSDGKVYGAGQNTSGQLGNGTVNASAAFPTVFGLPAGVKAKYVGVLGVATYVIGDDNNVYASGSCQYGILGNNYTITGCANKSSYVRVNLPTPVLSDPNTLPVSIAGSTPPTNMALDRLNVYLRMQGGRVYTWGINDYGELGNGTVVASSTPVKVGVYGDSGQPKATQVAFDGKTAYILDNTGVVAAIGNNIDGELGGAGSHLIHQATGMCLNNAGNSTANQKASLYTCVTAQSELVQFLSDKTIVLKTNATTSRCLANGGRLTTDGNPTYIYDCNGDVAAETWVLNDDGTIKNVGSGKCLNNPGNATALDSPLSIITCNAASTSQQWNLDQSPYLSVVPIPSTAGTVKSIATDQYSVLFLTSSGQVWGAGMNESGQLGNGLPSRVANPALTQMVLPAGRKAVNVYTTKAGGIGSLYANTYVVLDNGDVYGCGTNSFGQLGIGITSPSENIPKKMNLPSGVKAKVVQSGLGTTVILTTTGSIYTVGNNADGQLGDGTTNNSSIPQANRYTNVIPLVLF